MLDLDNFKRLNDAYGHITGDRVLASIASILLRQFRPSDILVRFGGDEFAVLLPNVSGDQAMVIAERARQAVSSYDLSADGDDAPLSVSVSIGVAELTEGQSLDALLCAADEAMYRAKRSGRNAVSD